MAFLFFAISLKTAVLSIGSKLNFGIVYFGHPKWLPGFSYRHPILQAV